MKTKKNFLKKLSAGILGFVMTLGVGAAGYAGAAGEVKADTATITFKGLTSDSKYVTTVTESTNGGVKFKWNNMNPSSGQTRGNQTSQSNMLSGANFYVFNTAAVGGSITKLELKTTATGTNKFVPASIYAAVGSSEFSSLSTTSGTAGSGSNTNCVWTFTGSSNNYFAIGMQKGGCSGTVNGVTLEITYSAASKTLSSIAVKTAPTKTSYVVGEYFDPTGLVITKTYSDNSTEDWSYADHADDFTFSPTTSTPLTTAHNSVSISVGGKTTSQSITVSSPTLNSIYISGTPNKTTYTAGESFETAGLKVMGKYSGIEDREITSGITWTATPSTLTKGTTSVSVTAEAGGKTSAAYNVSVTVSVLPVYELVTDVSDLADGQNFVFVGYAADTYRISKGGIISNHAAMAEITSSTTISNGVVAGSTLVSSEASIYTLHGSTGNWQLSDANGAYLAFSGTSNGNDNWASTNKDTDNAKFSITNTDGATSVEITSNAKSGRKISYNTSTKDLRNYGATQSAVYMFALAKEEVKYSVTNSLTNVTSSGATGSEAASNKSNYTAIFTPATGYNGVAIDSIEVGTKTLSSSDYALDGLNLTIPKGKIDGNITITAHGTKSVYTVNASGTGVTFSSKPNASYMTEYKISFNVSTGYDAPTSVSVTAGGSQVSATLNGTEITVPASSVTGNLVITANASLHTYTLTTSGLSNISCTQDTGSSLSHGGNFSATLEAVTGYTLDGAEITVTGATYNSTTHKVTKSGVNGNIVISGSAIQLLDSVIDIDEDEFSIQDTSSDLITVSYSRATLSSATAVLSDGVDVVNFGELTSKDASSSTISLTPKAKGEGMYTLTVSYINNQSQNKTKDFPIYVEVYGDELTGISLSAESDTYYLGDNLSLPTVTAHYSVSGDKEVTADWNTSNYNKYHTGSYSCVASFEGETATYTAEVSAKEYWTTTPIVHHYSYKLVNENLSDWSGKYLIVYGDECLNSTLSSDTTGNGVKVEINNGVIAVNDTTTANEVEIIKTEESGNTYYFLKTASNKYLGSAGSDNELKYYGTTGKIENSAYNTISYNNGSFTILPNKGSGAKALGYNSNTGQNRFRYFSSNKVSLYKYVDDPTGGQRVKSDEKHPIRIAEASCTKSPLIAGDTIAATDFTLSVQYDTSNDVISGLKPKSVSPEELLEGTHDYTLTYEWKWNEEDSTPTDTLTTTISLTAQAAPVLKDIYVTKDNPCDDVFTKNDTFTHNGIHVWAQYTDSTLYPDKEVTSSADITADLTTTETTSANVSYTEGDITKNTTYSITVNPIHTTELTLTMKDSAQNTIAKGDDGFYEIQPGENYTLSFKGNGDYDSATVTGGTANTKVVNNQTLSSTANSNEEVTFIASCDQVTDFEIKVRVIAAKKVSLDSFTTTSKGANASVDGNSGSFSGYIGNSVLIQIGTMNYSNPNIDDSELPSGLTLTGSFNNGVYSGAISVTAAVSGTYNLYVKESGGSDSKAISLTFSVVQDTISKIEITHEPNKVSYTLGETFDSTGLEVTATYASSSTRVLNASEYTISPFDMTKGDHIVTVSLNGSSTISDTFNVSVSIPELNIVTEGTKTEPDPEHNVPGTTPIAAGAAWSLLGKSDRVAKNSYLKNGTKFESYASSITVSFEGKALSSNKGSLFNFKLEATSNGDVVDKYTVYYAPINEDGTGYYVTTDDYEIISLTITGISESDKIDGYIFTACDKLNGATGSANGNLDHQNESASYKGFVPGTKEVPVYSNNVVTDEVYDFVMAYGGSNLTAANWDTIFTSEEYQAVVNAGKKGLFTNGVVSGTDDDGTKTSWKEFADFITKYDEIFATTDGLINYLGRTPVQTYTIKIDYNHDGQTSTVKVLPGDYKLPDAPTYEGHVFQGWTVGSEVKDAGSTITVTGNMTITANWAVGITFTNSAEFNFTGLTMNRFQYVFEGTCPEGTEQYGFLVDTSGSANSFVELTDDAIKNHTTGLTEKNKNKLVIGTSDGSKTVSVMFYYVDTSGNVVKSEVITMSFNSFVTAKGFDPSIYGDEYAIAALQYYIAGLQAE